MKRCLTPPVGPAADMAGKVRATVPVLETERLTLRAPMLDDFPTYSRSWQTLNPDSTDEENWQEFCVYTAGWLLHGHGLWAVERTADATLVGFLLLGLEWGDDEPEIGWVMHPDHRRQGYAAEAARAVQVHAARLFGRGGAVSYVALDNAPSAALAASIGARRDLTAEAAFQHETQVWRHGGLA